MPKARMRAAIPNSVVPGAVFGSSMMTFLAIAMRELEASAGEASEASDVGEIGVDAFEIDRLADVIRKTVLDAFCDHGCRAHDFVSM